MVIFVTIVLFIIVFVYIVYPYFGKTAVTRAEPKPVSPISKVNTKQVKAPEINNDIDAEIEKRISNIRRNKRRFCPQCGAENREESRFCAQCGERLPDVKNEN